MQYDLLQDVFTKQFCIVLRVISFEVNIHFSFNSLISSKPCEKEEKKVFTTSQVRLIIHSIRQWMC